MAKRREDIWFVRSNGGQGSYPVTGDGWRVVWVFAAGIVASAIMGAVLAQTMETWAWVTITGVGMAVAAVWFIMTARAHTDFSITYDEYVKDRKNA
ncbi:MAG TPA: hypothetical protein VL101_03230 [Nordella sp.]|nr:hypothetical protein [Nordella sp.]